MGTIEIASPSTARIDRTAKEDRYQQGGIRQYRLVDPGVDGKREPHIEVFELLDGSYQLRARATAHGRSAEAKVREIPSAAVLPDDQERFGDALAHLGRELALTDDDLATLDTVLDRSPATPIPLP